MRVLGWSSSRRLSQSHCLQRLMSAVAAAEECSATAAAAAAEERRHFTHDDVASLPLEQLTVALDRLETGPRRRDSLVALLRRCTVERALEPAKRLHAFLLQTGATRSTFIANNVVHMYGHCGDAALARQTFLAMPAKNAHSWVVAMSACLRNGQPRAAVDLYRTMLLHGCRPDNYAASAALTAAADTADLALGRAVVAALGDTAAALSDPVVANSLLNMYRKCGSMGEFERVFWAMPERDDVSWATLLAGRVEGGCDAAALEMLRSMDLEGVKVRDALMYTTLIDACGNLAAIAQGKRLHERVLASGIRVDVVLSTALLNMYAKCGRVDEARRVFDSYEPNRIAFSSMVAAYARNGHFADALKIFWSMEQRGFHPDSVTFTHVLYACSHGGFMEQACHYFTSLMPDRGICVVAEHYGCVVDLLARAGWLAEGERFIHRMPIPADSVSWMSLLQACRIHRNVEIGARAAERVFKLAPHRAGPYSLLSNIYSDAGMWDMAAKVKALMRERGVKKPGGRSWIEIQGRSHEFIVGDSWHPDIQQICQEIQRLSAVMREGGGYEPDVQQVLHDAEEEEKADILHYHSEKLAIGLALIKTPAGATINVVKNIRVCPDCHTFAKFASKTTERKIVIRDINLFHHMKDGKCSCRDYW